MEYQLLILPNAKLLPSSEWLARVAFVYELVIDFLAKWPMASACTCPRRTHQLRWWCHTTSPLPVNGKIGELNPIYSLFTSCKTHHHSSNQRQCGTWPLKSHPEKDSVGYNWTSIQLSQRIIRWQRNVPDSDPRAWKINGHLSHLTDPSVPVPWGDGVHTA